MLNFIHLRKRTTRTTSPQLHTNCRASIVIVKAAIVMVVTLFTSAAGQRIIPQTVQLQTAYVGVRYAFSPRELLPAGAPRLKWALVCKASEDSDPLECPTGVRLEDLRDNSGVP